MFVTLLMMALVSPSTAQESTTTDETPKVTLTRAEQLYFEGQRLYDAGEYDKAISAWKSGYKLSKRPGFLQNIALAQEAAGDNSAAVQTLYEYWPLLSPEDQPQIKEWIVDLEQKIAATPTPTSEGEAQSTAMNKQNTSASTTVEQEVSPNTPKQTSKQARWIPLVGWSLVAVSATAATALSLQSAKTKTELTSQCGESKDGLLCLDMAEPMLQQHNQLRLAATACWTLTAIGLSSVGVSEIITAKNWQLPSSPPAEPSTDKARAPQP